jgi:electron transfer flavoprotein-quinone oxidoreductase
MKDINSFQDAVHLLHTETMQHKVPNLICDFGRQFFTIKNEPMPKSRDMLKGAIKRHSSVWELAKLGFKAGKSL